jgi:hypothetical protein
MLVTQQWAQLIAGRNPVFVLRTAYWHDQLGYLAVTADVRAGHFASTEPVTMTGVSHYPQMYYSAVGGVANLLQLGSVTAWNLVSLALQIAAASGVGLVAGVLSKRWWVAMLAPMPFLTGTFAFLQGDDAWFVALEGHAVLWGPFGVLFSNNAETAGICTGVIVVALLAWVWSEPRTTSTRVPITVGAAAVTGLLSCVHTYAFLTMTYLLVSGCAIAGVWLAKRRALYAALSLGLLLVVFLAGPSVAAYAGQLPTLVFGLLPALPGLALALLRNRSLAVATGAAALMAAPQVVFTLVGIAGDDAFLAYRQTSNNLLGVVSIQALIGATVVLVPLAAVFFMGIGLRDVWSVTVAGAGLFALPILAVNDVWGANAEPYRFWIEGLPVGGVLAGLGLARLAGLLLSVRTARVRLTEAAEAPGSGGRSVGVALLITILATGILWAASLPDWVSYLRDSETQAVWNPGTPRERSISVLAQQATRDPASGLLTTDPCIDNRTAKVTSGSPIANYYLGMAWPANREDIDAINAARSSGELDFVAMGKSNTRWLLTDSTCTPDWGKTYAAELELVASEPYSLGASRTEPAGGQDVRAAIKLWRIEGR